MFKSYYSSIIELVKHDIRTLREPIIAAKLMNEQDLQKAIARK
jgi:hypothetical protein